MGVEANWTPRATPQPNRVENPIYVVCMRARILHAAANVPDQHKNILFPQAVMHSHVMRGLEVIDIDGVTKSRFEHLVKDNPPLVNYMQPWGMAGTIKDAPTNAPKSRHRGITCMFVGYKSDSSGDCMIMVDPTNWFQKYFSRDIT